MFDLQDFVDRCKQCAGSPHRAKQILLLMRSAVKDAGSIKQAIAPADPRAPLTDAQLFRSDDLLIFNATVPPHFVSPSHDHRMWAVIGIYEGQETNVFSRRSPTGLEEVNRREVPAGEAILLGPEVVHRVANPLDSITLGLHVYGGDLFAAERSMWNPYTGEELRYDVPQFSKWCVELSRMSRTL
jgi:predicted metal-dependent enzyme (double-stranded beta helix superfamily)